MNRTTQEAILDQDSLAPEYTRNDLSQVFDANGSTDPDDADYKKMVAEKFASYKLVVDGLVDWYAGI